MNIYGVVVHGGAGRLRHGTKRKVLAEVEKAVVKGFKTLNNGCSSLNAVVEAVRVMEDSPFFNAGKGSHLNLKGEIEMDACVMNGRNLDAGAVALVKSVRNPVLLAKIVMEETDHVLIAGRFAEEIAKRHGLKEGGVYTEKAMKTWRKGIENLRKGKVKYLHRLKGFLNSMETVGAVAIDRNGDLSAATSTGGLLLKLPGRIGDTPLIGCGTYADNESGAVSVTGVGEAAIKLVLAKTICGYMAHGLEAFEAIHEGLMLVKRRQNNLPIGLIAIDRRGNIGIGHNTPEMPWAYITNKDGRILSGLSFPR